MAFSSSTQLISGSEHNIGQSFRFNSSTGQSLYREYSDAGNQKLWTFGCWLKKSSNQKSKGTNNNINIIFAGYVDANNKLEILFDPATDKLRMFSVIGGTDSGDLITNNQFSDTGWYHLLFQMDAANTSFKIFVNGVEEATTITTAVANVNHTLNSATTHTLGKGQSDTEVKLDGLMTEVAFLDGVALTPTSFGYFDGHAKFKAIPIKGLTYGNEGWYLPFITTSTAAGYNIVTWFGTASARKVITGVGFKPGTVLITQMTGGTSVPYQLLSYGINNGVGHAYRTNSSTPREDSASTLISFDSDGFTLGLSDTVNKTNVKYAGFCVDYGQGSYATNTDGSIDSSVLSNPAYGQSIVKYTSASSTGVTDTVGHGLNSAPFLIETLYVGGTGTGPSNGATTGERVKMYWTGTNYPSTDSHLQSASTWSFGSSANEDTFMNDTAPTDTLISLGSTNETAINGFTNTSCNYIARCFAEVSGYCKTGGYTGSSNDVVIDNLGFAPAVIWITQQHTGGQIDTVLCFNRILNYSAEDNDETIHFHQTGDAEDFDGDSLTWGSDGFTVTSNSSSISGSRARVHSWIAWADTRVGSHLNDVSGKGNHWKGNLGNSTQDPIDVLEDTPLDDFAKWNLNDKSENMAIQHGGLGLEPTFGSANTIVRADMALTGKHYWEILGYAGLGNSAGYHLGVSTHNAEKLDGHASAWHTHGLMADASNGEIQSSIGGDLGSNLSGETAFQDGIIGFAVDVPNGTLQVFKDGTSLGTITHASITSPDIDVSLGGHPNIQSPQPLFPSIKFISTSGGRKILANFGQDSSFGSRKTPQFNTDSKGRGDFAHAPPAGFLALCKSNLPETSIDGSKHFNTITWTGDNASPRSFTGVGFQPDLVWSKARSNAYYHWIYDAVRTVGSAKGLGSSTTLAEGGQGDAAYGYLSSLNADGFTATTGTTNNSDHNATNVTYVAWNWKANGSGSSNTNGSTNSTVSANTDAGFSIVSYTGSSGPDTIGHGLSKAPEMIIVKDRSSAQEWLVYHHSLTDAKDKYLRLDTTSAVADNTFWNDTAPTNQVFSVGDSQPVNSGHGDSYIAYCFHSVDGYSAVGSYVGNGNADGTFVYTGFRPKFILTKNSSASSTSWVLTDTSRSTYNVTSNALMADAVTAEQAYTYFDITSNGFKARNSSSWVNGSGNTIIYLAFAETPFKYSNAR